VGNNYLLKEEISLVYKREISWGLRQPHHVFLGEASFFRKIECIHMLGVRLFCISAWYPWFA